MQEKQDENQKLRSLFITEILVQSCWLRTEKTQLIFGVILTATLLNSSTDSSWCLGCH